MGITITPDGHILSGPLFVQQGGAAIVGDSSIDGHLSVSRKISAPAIGISPGEAGAPFELGENAQGVLVDGLNADLFDGLHGSDYVQIATPQTVTAVHTFNPDVSGSPFILGENAANALVQGFNADKLDGFDALAFVQKATSETISAVHTFNPDSPGAPFLLGANAQGQTVTGFDADTLDGVHGSAFLKVATAQTVTAQHTFNPTIAGAPFVLGANAQNQLVTGFNADKLDNKDASDFVHVATAGTITARHTFSPSTAASPFILGANAQGQLVSGLNAEYFNSLSSSAFIRRDSSNTITAIHTFNPVIPGAPFTLGGNAQGHLITGLNAEKVGGISSDDMVLTNSAKTISATHLFDTGGRPFQVGSSSTTMVTNLNADMVDGKHISNIVVIDAARTISAVHTFSNGLKGADGYTITLMRQAGIAAVNTKSLTSITNDYGVADHVIEDVTSDWATSYVAVRRNFKECTTEINNLITVVEDLRTKLNTLINQHETAGFNAAA